MGVTGKGINERFSSGLVIPSAGRLACAWDVIVSLEDRAKLRSQLLVGDLEQRPYRRPNQGHGVLGRDCVVERGRIEHTLAADKSSLFRDFQHCIENPIGPRRRSQPRAHIDQNRMHEARKVELQPPGCVPPPPVESEPADRVSIAESCQPLQHHHHRHNPWPHRATTHVGNQVRKKLARRSDKRPLPQRSRRLGALPGSSTCSTCTPSVVSRFAFCLGLR